MADFPKIRVEQGSSHPLTTKFIDVENGIELKGIRYAKIEYSPDELPCIEMEIYLEEFNSEAILKRLGLWEPDNTNKRFVIFTRSTIAADRFWNVLACGNPGETYKQMEQYTKNINPEFYEVLIKEISLPK